MCDYCGQPARLVNGRWGWRWVCEPCDASVGTHEGSADHAPLGRLANAELRAWKIRAHAAFDPLWNGGALTRSEAYGILAGRLGLTGEQAHIGMFDVEQCKRAVAVFGGSVDLAPSAPATPKPGFNRVFPNGHLPVDMTGAIRGKDYRQFKCRSGPTPCATLPWDICPGCPEQIVFLGESRRATGINQE